MQDLKLDRRVQRTRGLLRAALLDLILTRGYDAISIQDITDFANLGRATFYLHYRDKDDLLADSMQTLVDEFMEGLLAANPGDWQNEDGVPLLFVFEYAGRKTGLYRALMGSQGGLVVTRRLQELIVLHTSAITAQRAQALGLPADFLRNYFAGSLLALVFWWLENNQPYPPEEMVRLFHAVSPFRSGNFTAPTPPVETPVA